VSRSRSLPFDFAFTIRSLKQSSTLPFATRIANDYRLGNCNMADSEHAPGGRRNSTRCASDARTSRRRFSYVPNTRCDRRLTRQHRLENYSREHELFHTHAATTSKRCPLRAHRNVEHRIPRANLCGNAAGIADYASILRCLKMLHDDHLSPAVSLHVREKQTGL
jgi:hypothetical protein